MHQEFYSLNYLLLYLLLYFIYSYKFFGFNFSSLATLNFLKFIEAVFSLPTFKSFNFVFELLRLVGTLTNFLTSTLSTSVLKAIKSTLAAKLDS